LIQFPRDNCWTIWLKLGLLSGFWSQHIFIMDESISRFLSPKGFGISSLSPDRTWKSISAVVLTKGFEFDQRKEVDNLR